MTYDPHGTAFDRLPSGAVARKGYARLDMDVVGGHRMSREKKKQEKLDFGPRFNPRFLDKHAGPIMTEPRVALVELVSNCWDANATRVDIDWPFPGVDGTFSITDNGHGMTAEQVNQRWPEFWYDRLDAQGEMAENPTEEDLPPRKVYGRNGKGRWAVFCFGREYILRTWREGAEVAFRIRRATDKPVNIVPTDTQERPGHGTTVEGVGLTSILLSEEDVRTEIGLRFLANPHFAVFVNGKPVQFADIPEDHLRREQVPVEGFGLIEMIVLDTKRTDRTSRQHGICWHVGGKQVGECNWDWFDRLSGMAMDRRTIEARRHTIIIRADLLLDHEAVFPDWSDFAQGNPAWNATRQVVSEKIEEWYGAVTKEEQTRRKKMVRRAYREQYDQMPVLGKDRWKTFLESVVAQCPRMREEDLMQVAGVLATLETSRHKYELLHWLNQEDADGLDSVTEVMRKWDAQTAKIVLDELEGRLTLLRELKTTLRDPAADELHDIQPLFKRGLWIFGPQFESVHFTSNEGMTAILQKLLKRDVTGSRNRPDFVALPDSNVGLYSLPSYDGEGGEDGVEQLVIVELKARGTTVGDKEKGQVWKYVKELAKKGAIIARATKVRGFALGPSIDPLEVTPRKEWDGRVSIKPLSYETFIQRAESRTLGLYEKVKEAPFLDDKEDEDIDDEVGQTNLLDQ